MQAYISISYGKRKLLDEAIETIIKTCNELNVVPFVFVDHYSFDSKEEKQMMAQAFIDIDNSGFLIAETSDKGIGIGIEVGYARARNKPIIYIRHSNAEHSSTVSGTSDFHVIYDHAEDMKDQLSGIIATITR